MTNALHVTDWNEAQMIAAVNGIALEMFKDENGILRGYNDSYGMFTNPTEFACWVERQ